MIISIQVSQDELVEMKMDEWQLVDHIIETLDGDVKELVGYNVLLNSKEVD